jgi:hypothetical protein
VENNKISKRVRKEERKCVKIRERYERGEKGIE